MTADKADILAKLQREILSLQGYKPVKSGVSEAGLTPILRCFPDGVFPTGAIHEFLTTTPETIAATYGFMGGLLGNLMKNNGACLWVSMGKRVFPPGLAQFGIVPHEVVFVNVQKENDLLWVIEQGLKCEGLAAVVGELRGLDMIASRRLKLAAEYSRVTGLMLRQGNQTAAVNTCAARWQVTPLKSIPVDDLPGVGFPSWRVELLRVINGRTGSWQVMWQGDEFQMVYHQPVSSIVRSLNQKTG